METPISHPFALTGITLLISAFVYKFIIYPIFLSPLSKIPAAHPLAKVTSLWMQYQRWRHRDFDVIRDAFARKGPYVRLGPNEMVVNSIEGIQSAYGVGQHNFDKHWSYEYFITHGTKNMFSSIGKDHGFRRRRIAGVYAKSFVQSSPHVRAILTSVLCERMLPLFTQSSNPAGLDLVPVLQSYALDFMSSFMFGLSRGLNFIRDEKAREYWFEEYNRAYPAKDMFWLLEVYPACTRFLCRLGFPLLPKGHDEAHDMFEKWALGKIQESEQALNVQLQEKNDTSPGELPILYNAVRTGIAKDAGIRDTEMGEFTPDHKQLCELASECYDHLIATRDTFGTSFTYVIYEISRHQDAQDELRRELLSIENPFVYTETSRSMPEPAALERLPFLNAVIKEGLRLRNNTPGSDPRVTPTHRATSSVGPVENLPPGVRVGAYAWCIHRNPDVFSNPTQWDPSRWIDTHSRGGVDSGIGSEVSSDSDRRPKEKGSKPDKWFFAFSGGSRGCVGQQTAVELMRYALAAMYTNFKTTIADESQYPGDKGFVSGECTEKLFVRFERLDNGAAT
ncbi:cytochrome P450 [Diplogelasinospora grovesii]|uniref:Cytochrome P450 n=1 Tax=Diplogelasinospora grovesii TaxID=303347 RepID=A0AAN6N5C9_9PEZI|nr:cytochrome P450 [Diplogelasinospora grovesii]